MILILVWDIQEMLFVVGLTRDVVCRQEAIQAAMSEKDANIALLEMTSTKQRRNTEEIDKLNREKEKLQQQLKEVVSQAEGVKTSQT